MKTGRSLSLLMALGLSLSALGGCSGADTRIAAQYSGGEIPAGIYLYNQISAYNEGLQKLTDFTKDPMKQEIDGVKFPDWLTARAQTLTEAYAVTEAECARLGVALDADTEASVRRSIAQDWENGGDLMRKNHIAQSSVEAVALNLEKRRMLFEKYYGEGGEKEIPAAELESYYRDNYRRVLYLALSTTDTATGAPLEGEALEQRKAENEDYAKRALGGEKLFDLMVEYDDKAHEAGAAHDHGALVESEQEAVVHKSASYFPAAFLDAVFAEEQLDTVRRYDDESGQMTILYEVRELMGDGQHFESAKESLRAALKGETFEDELAAMADGAGFVWNDAAVKRYTAGKLKLQ